MDTDRFGADSRFVPNGVFYRFGDLRLFLPLLANRPDLYLVLWTLLTLRTGLDNGPLRHNNPWFVNYGVNNEGFLTFWRSGPPF